MRIELEEIVMDGVGPFADKSTLSFAGKKRVFVFAPNGHGKTSTIDLMRWLFQGERAMPNLRSLKEGILNHDRHRALGQGTVTATFTAEGRGRYRVKRTEVLGRSQSVLEVSKWDERTAKFIPVSNPDGVLLRFFPPERLGFNLLTGEHIEEFLQDIQGDVVRKSIEKLLQFPEIATANAELQSIAQDMVQQRDKELKAKGKAQQAAQDAEKMRAAVASLERQIADIDTKANSMQDQLNGLGEQIGALQQGADNGEKLQRWKEILKRADKAIEGKESEIRGVLSGAWRQLVVAGVAPQVSELLGKIESAKKAMTAWEAKQGQIKLLKSVLKEEECICLRTVDKKAAEKIEAAIAKIESQRPADPPKTSINEWKLQSWRTDERAGQMLDTLKGYTAELSALKKDRAKALDELEAVEKGIDTKALEQVNKLKVERDNLVKLQRAENSRREVLKEALAEQQDQLNKALIKQGKAADADRYVKLAALATEYANALPQVIDGALPWYRTKLQEEVQRIFRKLYQKDPNAEVLLDERTFQPRVRLKRPDERLPSAAGVSEGEKARLGMALLLAFREVAAERPFLMLDAPFSPLDDEGRDALLKVLGDSDSQLVVFTKNRFVEDEYDRIVGMRPVVFQMDWHEPPKGSWGNGHTTFSPSETAALLVRKGGAR